MNRASTPIAAPLSGRVFTHFCSCLQSGRNQFSLIDLRASGPSDREQGTQSLGAPQVPDRELRERNRSDSQTSRCQQSHCHCSWNYRITSLTLINPGNPANIRHLRNESRFTFEERDICKPFDPGCVDYVFNLASPASPREYLRLALETLRVGSVGTETTLEIAQKHTQDSCMPPHPSAMAIRWNIPSLSPIWATLTRPVCGRSTTRPSGSLKR